MGFDKNGAEAVILGQTLQLSQENRFPDAAQTRQEQTFFAPLEERPAEKYPSLLKHMSRPTNSGGGDPAPGENGFLMLSIKGAS